MQILLVKLGSAFESVDWFPKASGEHLWKDRILQIRGQGRLRLPSL